MPLNIGTTAYPAVPALDIAGLPIYTIKCPDGTSLQVTNIGRAMISGNCTDVGKVKGLILRGLAGRAPYFHNGAAQRLDDVVEFYDQRFSLNLTDQQKKNFRMVLGLLGNAPKITITAQNGQLFVGPFKVRDLPPLY